MATTRLLDGIKVLDLSQYVPGPFATRQLADLGAEVIKIEPPDGDPMRCFMRGKPDQPSDIYRHINRGKKVVRLDLRQDQHKKSLQSLIQQADVLLESYRPGVMQRLGFGYKTLHQLNRNLIICSLSGYGQTGPYQHRAGHDINYLAASGGLVQNGLSEKPVMTYPPLADHAGAMQASQLILAALISRQRNHRGHIIDVSLFESGLSWQYLPLMDSAKYRATSLLNGGAACYNIYRCQDGNFVTLGAIEPHFWQRFCETMNNPEWIDRQFDAMPQQTLIDTVANLIQQQPVAYWSALFEQVDCCFEVMQTRESLPDHPQIQARQALHKSGPNYPAWIDRAPVNIDRKYEEYLSTEIRWNQTTNHV